MPWRTRSGPCWTSASFSGLADPASGLGSAASALCNDPGLGHEPGSGSPGQGERCRCRGDERLGVAPISREARLAAKASPSAKPALLAALTDGEDFELLFTLASRDAVPLLDAWREQFPKLPLACIGKIKAGDGITIRDKHSVRPLTAHGYDHFA